MPAPCQHPILRGCCRTCDACDYQGAVYSNRQTFPDPNNVCGECECEGGTVTCSVRQCPHVECDNPVMVMLCLIVSLSVSLCLSLSLSLNNVCGVCECEGGTVTCSVRQCPPVDFDNPVMVMLCLIVSLSLCLSLSLSQQCMWGV